MQKKVFVSALIKVEQKDGESFNEFIMRLRKELSEKLTTTQLSLMVV